MEAFFEKLKWIAILAACILAGSMLCIMAVIEPDFEIASRIFGFVCGLIFLALPTLVGYNLIKERMKNKDIKKEARARSIYPFFDTVETDQNETEARLTGFRADLGRFFENRGIGENSALQGDTTQLFYNILSFRKKRLDRKHITLRLASERKNYETGGAVRVKRNFDGKYEAAQIKETIAAKSTFFRENGMEFYSHLDTHLAHYTLINAKQEGADHVICPNCGNKTTRENLVDGCDYCGTHFSVEDLGTKVADFALRDDYDIQYAKYKAQRQWFGVYVFLGIAAVTFVLMLIIGFSMGKAEMLEIGDGSMAIALLAMVMAAAFAGFCFGILGMYFFWFCVFPFVQIGASLSYYSKGRLNRMKEAQRADTLQEEKIRKSDPLFSVAGFYSNVQNKLASIHYAENAAGINAFSDAELSSYLPKYADVIDMAFEEMRIEGYAVEGDYQRATVRTTLSLRLDNGQRVETKTEHLRLTLKKSASCKTLAVSGPKVFRCKGCGASISLAEGKTCEYCGSTFDLKQYDWMISDYQVLNT